MDGRQGAEDEDTRLLLGQGQVTVPPRAEVIVLAPLSPIEADRKIASGEAGLDEDGLVTQGLCHHPKKSGRIKVIVRPHRYQEAMTDQLTRAKDAKGGARVRADHARGTKNVVDVRECQVIADHVRPKVQSDEREAHARADRGHLPKRVGRAATVARVPLGITTAKGVYRAKKNRAHPPLM